MSTKDFNIERDEGISDDLANGIANEICSIGYEYYNNGRVIRYDVGDVIDSLNRSDTRLLHHLLGTLVLHGADSTPTSLLRAIADLLSEQVVTIAIDLADDKRVAMNTEAEIEQSRNEAI